MGIAASPVDQELEHKHRTRPGLRPRYCLGHFDFALCSCSAGVGAPTTRTPDVTSGPLKGSIPC
jgi:hypothetical protein